MTPPRITPGKPAPTLSIGPSLASSRICSRRIAMMSPAGRLLRSTCGSPGLGYILTFPSSTPSTIPAQRCPVANTPMLRPISPLLKPHQLIDAVECGNFVTLRQSRIVEDRLHEVIDGAFE